MPSESERRTNDEDLFGSLVEQCNIHNDSDDMNSESVLPTCTQQPHNEPSIDNSDNSTHQLVDKDDSQRVECHPYSLSIDDDVFTIAFNVLEQVAIMYHMTVIAYLVA